MTRKEAAAEILRKGLDAIIADLDAIGMRAAGNAPGKLKATIVLRHTADDQATILFGHDDEATLIVALQTLGASRGREHYRATAEGLTKDSG